MVRDDGAYNLVEGEYKGVKLEAPFSFWEEFDEARLRAAGYG
jgi:hypothetical protein